MDDLNIDTLGILESINFEAQGKLLSIEDIIKNSECTQFEDEHTICIEIHFHRHAIKENSIVMNNFLSTSFESMVCSTYMHEKLNSIYVDIKNDTKNCISIVKLTLNNTIKSNNIIVKSKNIHDNSTETISMKRLLNKFSMLSLASGQEFITPTGLFCQYKQFDSCQIIKLIGISKIKFEPDQIGADIVMAQVRA